MYDVSGLRPQNKETALAIIVAVIVLVVILCAGYGLGIRNSGATAGTDLHTNGNAAQGVRDEVNFARSNIGAAKSGIDNAATAAGRIEERIADAQERAEYVKGTADEGRRIIAECQSILREVRRRGEANQIKN